MLVDLSVTLISPLGAACQLLSPECLCTCTWYSAIPLSSSAGSQTRFCVASQAMDKPFAGTKGDGAGGGIVSCGGGDICVTHDPFTPISTLRFSSEPSVCTTLKVY